MKTKHMVVFDCETTTPIMRGEGFSNLRVSIAVAYDYSDKTYHVYREEDIPKLCQLIRQAELVVGFNHVGFDLPLLRNYDASLHVESARNFDIMKAFEKSQGFRIKLDHLLNNTLGTKKSAHGLQAVEWYKQGEIDKIIEYCKEDVRQTRMLFDYILEHKSAAYTNRDGERVWAPIEPPDVEVSPKGENLNLF